MTRGMPRRLAPLLILAAIALIAAGCGSKDAATATKGADTFAASTQAAGQAPAGTTAAQSPAAATKEGTSATVQNQPKQWNQPPAMQLEPGKDYTATLKTSKGDIVIDLDEQGAPITVNNFVFLVQQGFYTNVPFHRVISGFVIQTGDPTGTGAGGPGYKFKDEPVTKDYTRGMVAMANAGPNTNGSQFFITQGDLSGGRLPKNYTIFGEVTQGMDVVDAIANVPVKVGRSGEKSSPVDPVTLESVEISTK